MLHGRNVRTAPRSFCADITLVRVLIGLIVPASVSVARLSHAQNEIAPAAYRGRALFRSDGRVAVKHRGRSLPSLTGAVRGSV